VDVADLRGGGEVAEVRRGIGVVFDETFFFEKGVIVQFLFVVVHAVAPPWNRH